MEATEGCSYKRSREKRERTEEMGMLLLPLKLPGCYRSYSARTQTFAEGTIATAKYDLELVATAADVHMRARTHTHTHVHTHTRNVVSLSLFLLLLLLLLLVLLPLPYTFYCCCYCCCRCFWW